MQPGSRYIKIGRSNDPAPLLIPSIIARKKRSKVSNGSDGMDVDESQSTRNVDEVGDFIQETNYLISQ